MRLLVRLLVPIIVRTPVTILILNLVLTDFYGLFTVLRLRSNFTYIALASATSTYTYTSLSTYTLTYTSVFTFA